MTLFLIVLFAVAAIHVIPPLACHYRRAFGRRVSARHTVIQVDLSWCTYDEGCRSLDRFPHS